MLTPADFTNAERFEENMQRLLKGLGVRAQIFISAKRQATRQRRLNTLIEDSTHGQRIAQLRRRENSDDKN